MFPIVSPLKLFVTECVVHFAANFVCKHGFFKSVCMCLYVFVCVCMCLYVIVCVCICLYVFVCDCMCFSVCMCLNFLLQFLIEFQYDPSVSNYIVQEF